SSGSLDDARTRVESTPGLTDFRTRSGGECEVGALGIGTYWFARSVNEITLHPRPASPGTTTIVETDHPLCSCQSPNDPRTRPRRAEQVQRTAQPPRGHGYSSAAPELNRRSSARAPCG